jgi:hypothetical protein
MDAKVAEVNPFVHYLANYALAWLLTEIELAIVV